MKKEFIAPKIKVTSLEALNILAGSGPSQSKTHASLQGMTFVSGTGQGQTTLDYEW